MWAIGTGRNATPEQADEAHAHIRGRLRQWFGGDAADQCRILYGGQVKPDNIRELVALPDVDGALVGGASLDVRGFFDIVAQKPQEPRCIIGRYALLLLATLYVLICFLLLVVVLLQQGKGGDMARAFGGCSSQTAFGARAGATVLTRATTVLGVLFMLGAIVLGIIGRRAAAR